MEVSVAVKEETSALTDKFASDMAPLGLHVMRARASRMLELSVGLWIFCGGFVLIEPSPYELAFLAVLALAVLANIDLYRSTTALLSVIIGFIPFALIAVFQVRNSTLADAMLFSVVTVFLLLTSYFVANYVAEATEKRMRLIMRAYTIAALCCAIIGTLAYLGLMPGADLFMLYGRAKATFKDPNVFGPFLVLPAMFALQRVLLGARREQIFGALVYAVLSVGVFLSFSRGAWGHLLASSLIVLILCFCLEARAREKLQIMLMTVIGAITMVVGFLGLLSIPAVAELFAVRAQGQIYDMGETGRFGRQGYAFGLALENPFGLGPLEFRTLKIAEEPHNVYVSVLLNYGWGGGGLYFLLVALTLWRGLKGLLRPSPYRLMMIPLIATFSVLVMLSAIIDSDHWRHWFLLAGLIWGVSTAIQLDPRRAAPRTQMLL
ncbi:MAG: polysaccharide biosynthesis O-antigen ligase family protein UppF [Devosia indica]